MPSGVRFVARVVRGAEVRGAALVPVLEALGPFRARGAQILAEHGIARIDVGRWYPLRAYVDSLFAIRDQLGPNTLLQIGKQIPQHVQVPIAAPNLEAALEAMLQSFDLNHRGLEPGLVSYQLISHRAARIVTATPYPCEFERGVIDGLIRLLLDVTARVEHAEEPCRERGVDTCVHTVTLPLV